MRWAERQRVEHLSKECLHFSGAVKAAIEWSPGPAVPPEFHRNNTSPSTDNGPIKVPEKVGRAAPAMDEHDRLGAWLATQNDANSLATPKDEVSLLEVRCV